MRAFRKYGLSELELHEGDRKIILRCNTDKATNQTIPIKVQSRGGSEIEASENITNRQQTSGSLEHADESNTVTVASPIVGIFHRSSAPDAKPFVTVGAKVERGAVLCIVEAMKIMNQIESEISGTIVGILATDGQPIEYGQALFTVRRAS